MKNTHTPGPWVIQTCNVNGPFLDSFFISTEERIVCRFPTGTGQFSETGQENLANARLIAAAPDLLSALERLANEYAALMNSQGAAIDIGQPGSEFTAGQWVGSRLQSPMQQAWKAIAKAKGEA
jgi:hypothetical protein